MLHLYKLLHIQYWAKESYAGNFNILLSLASGRARKVHGEVAKVPRHPLHRPQKAAQQHVWVEAAYAGLHHGLQVDEDGREQKS